MKRIEFIINTSEITAGTRGASLGPGALMVAAQNKGSKLFSMFPIEKIQDENQRINFETKHLYAKRIDGFSTVFERVSETICKKLNQKVFPVVIASDHGSAGGTIAGIKASFPNKRLGVIWVDAHADLHSPYTTPSGNLHGMPLAIAIGEDNLDCKINDVSEETKTFWNKLKNSRKINPKIASSDIVFISVRDTEDPEDFLINKYNIKNFSVEDVNQKGAKKVAEETLIKLNDCDIIYISFDVDSMDPNLTSHGTGTPVDNGLSPEQVKEILLCLVDSPKIICFELVEINPCLDEKTNKMAEAAFEVFEPVVEKISRN
jgi:arginase